MQYLVHRKHSVDGRYNVIVFIILGTVKSMNNYNIMCDD